MAVSIYIDIYIDKKYCVWNTPDKALLHLMISETPFIQGWSSKLWTTWKELWGTTFQASRKKYKELPNILIIRPQKLPPSAPGEGKKSWEIWLPRGDGPRENRPHCIWVGISLACLGKPSKKNTGLFGNFSQTSDPPPQPLLGTLRSKWNFLGDFVKNLVCFMPLSLLCGF